MSNSNIEEKKYRLEYFKFLLMLVTIILTIIGIVGGYIRYSDEKTKDRNVSYQNNISMLASENFALQKTALQELVQYYEKYDKLAPIIVDYMITQRLNGNTSLDPYLITAFVTIGNPVIKVLTEENHKAQQELNIDLLKITQWAIGQMIRNNVGMRFKSIALEGVLLENLNLSNIRITNLIISESRLENVIFDGSELAGIDMTNIHCKKCSFWGTRFIKGTKLYNSTFEECNFQDSLFDSDLKQTQFRKCNFLNVRITYKDYVNKDTFVSSIHHDTVRFIKNGM